MTSSVETAMRVASVGIGITLMPQSYISLPFACPVTPYFCHLEEYYGPGGPLAAYPKDSELSGPTAEMVKFCRKSIISLYNQTPVCHYKTGPAGVPFLLSP